MRSVLASLSLLLLASCKIQHRNTIHWDPISIDEERLSNATIVTLEMKEEFLKKFYEVRWRDEDVKYDGNYALNSWLSNTIFALTIDGNNLWDNAEPHYRDAIYNGVLCDNVTLYDADDIKELVYGNAGAILSRDERRKEEDLAKNPLYGIDCTSASSDHCFCEERKPLFYCLALRMKKKIIDSGFIMKKCDDEILKPIIADSQLERWQNRTIGVKNYLRMYGVRPYGHSLGNGDGYRRIPFTHDIFEGRYNASQLVVDHRYENMIAQFYCEAMEPREAVYVKELYAANPTRWMLERELYTVDGPMKKNVYTTCLNDANFNTTAFGKCLCEFDKGFNFCFYKVIAKYIQQEGFLDCETLSFNKTVKPSLELAFSMPASTTTFQIFLSAATILLLLLINGAFD